MRHSYWNMHQYNKIAINATAGTNMRWNINTIHTQQSQCCLCRLVRACLVRQGKAALTATLGNWCACADRGPSKLLILQAHQLVIEASGSTTAYLETCSRGTPSQRNARADKRVKVWQKTGVTQTQWLLYFHAYLGTRQWSQCWNSLIWSSPSGMTAAAYRLHIGWKDQLLDLPVGLRFQHAKQKHQPPSLIWSRCSLTCWGMLGELNHIAESDGLQEPAR